MPKRSFLLPVIMVIVIVVVIGVVALTGRSNAPNVSGDPAYSHYVCTFNRYCAGPDCSDEPNSFVAYLEHADGQPRLEIDGMSGPTELTRTPNDYTFVSNGGDLKGTLILFPDRSIDFFGTSGDADTLMEHYGSGSCDRRHDP